MRDLMDEYGTLLLGAAASAFVAGMMGYAFVDPEGVISKLFGRLVSLYL